MDPDRDRLRREYPLFEPQRVTPGCAGPWPNAAGRHTDYAYTVSWLITRSDRTAGFIHSAVCNHVPHDPLRHAGDSSPELLRGLAMHRWQPLIMSVGWAFATWMPCCLAPKKGVEQYLVDGLQH